MDTKATWEDWATRLVSAASVIALGYFVLFVDFSGQGRFWDKLAQKVPALAKIIPPAAGSQATVVVKTMPTSEAYANRTLVVGEPAPAPAQAQPSAAPASAQAQVQAQASDDARKMPAPRLTSSLTPQNFHDNSQNRVISVPAAPAAEADAPQAAPDAAAPAETTSRSALAAKASYGAASRSEMMGRAAGPVYNFKGKSKKR